MGSRIAVGLMTLAALACGTALERSPGEGTWVGTITSDGDVTTVVNESGSVWGGTARLVEELSIGVETGEDPYMFGRVRGIAAGNDLLYVLDAQVPTIRVFESDGSYLHSVGQAGQGPGEFERPHAIEVGPRGRIYVQDANERRILVFEPDGRVAGPLHVDEPLSGFHLISASDGRLFADVALGPGAGPFDRAYGVATIDPSEGAQVTYREVPDFGWTRTLVTTENRGGGSFAGPVPFAPNLVWTVLSTGDIAAGVADEFRFELLRPGGAKTVVRKAWTPIPVVAEEGRWRALRTELQAQANQPDWTWNGPEVPGHKPAYDRFYADRSGRLWVIREGPGVRNPGCDWPSTIGEYFDFEPCWTAPQIVDVFDGDGRFLGEVAVPAGFSWFPRPYMRDNLVFASVEDEAGTVTVKRYRLVMPECSSAAC